MDGATEFIKLSKIYLFSPEIYFPVDIVDLFKRGYKITHEDQVFIEEVRRQHKNLDKGKYSNLILAVKLNDAVKFDLAVFKYKRELLTISSIKRGKSFLEGENLLSIMNNSLMYSKSRAELILHAVSFYNRTSEIVDLDKKGSFEKLRNALFAENVKQDMMFIEIGLIVFPELRGACKRAT